MTLIFALLAIVLFFSALVPVAKVLLGFYGFTEALGGWGVLLIVGFLL